MSTPETNKLREALAGVIQKHTEASDAFNLLHAQWTEAAAKGDDAAADKLEIEIERTRRLMQRFDLRRASLEQDIGSAEEVEQAARAAKLKATADAILNRATKRITDMKPLALALAKAADELESDLAAWKEARYYAQDAGADTEGFAIQPNVTLTRELQDSLGATQRRVAYVTKELNRVSVFQ